VRREVVVSLALHLAGECLLEVELHGLVRGEEGVARQLCGGR
jgi:hypothetical protein